MALVLVVVAAGCGGSQPSHRHQGDGHGHMQHRFDDAEKWAKVFDDPGRDKWQQPGEVIRMLNLEPGMTVVDLGAGTGYFLPHLSGAAGQVIALDVEPNLVDHMQKRVVEQKLANVDVRLVEPDDPALPPGSVDRILIVDTWHHIANRVAYTKKLVSALRPGGVILVVDFTLESKMGPPRAARIPPAEVVRELQQAGLSAAIDDADLPEQYVVSGALPD